MLQIFHFLLCLYILNSLFLTTFGTSNLFIYSNYHETRNYIYLIVLVYSRICPTKIAREYIEWSDIWIPGANKTDLPHVLLIGNSITRGYYGKVEAALKEKAYVGAALQFEKYR